MKGGVYLIVKIDERTKAAIEEILSRRKDAIISVTKDKIVVMERSVKTKHSANLNGG